jgi:hypothetical protein
MGVNVLLLSTARGSGPAVNNKTKQETFMKMASAGAGLGMEVKDYVVVFVFENDRPWHNFVVLERWLSLEVARRSHASGRCNPAAVEDTTGRTSIVTHNTSPSPGLRLNAMA